MVAANGGSAAPLLAARSAAAAAADSLLLLPGACLIFLSVYPVCDPVVATVPVIGGLNLLMARAGSCTA